jgi:hypothetical protein
LSDESAKEGVFWKDQDMMKRSEYDQLAREFIRREPFQPFVIEYEDGRRFVVEQRHQLPDTTWYIRPDGEFDFLDNEEVRRVVEMDKAAAE